MRIPTAIARILAAMIVLAFGMCPDLQAASPMDETSLTEARRLFAGRDVAKTLGPYLLYTDCRDQELLEYLDRVARGVEVSYAARYGLEPAPGPRESIVLYQREAPYRQLQGSHPELLGAHSSGHNTGGVVVFFVGERNHQEVASTLVHELTHLLNRRSLGAALPPFLDEGLADDLAMAKWNADGSVDFGAFGGELSREEDGFSVTGALSTLWYLRDLATRYQLPPLRRVVALDWDDFVQDDLIAAHYGVSAVWIRRLLSRRESNVILRNFLGEIAAGSPADPERLRRDLGRDWERIDSDLRGAIKSWAEAAGLPSSLGIGSLP